MVTEFLRLLLIFGILSRDSDEGGFCLETVLLKNRGLLRSGSMRHAASTQLYLLKKGGAIGVFYRGAGDGFHQPFLATRIILDYTKISDLLVNKSTMLASKPNPQIQSFRPEFVPF